MEERVQLGVHATSGSSVSAQMRLFDGPCAGARTDTFHFLEVLDEPELLSMIAGQLAVRDQLSLSQSCKLFALIVGENHQNMTYLSTVVELSLIHI